MSNTKSAAFACSVDEYKQLKEVAASADKSISAFIREIVWPHVEKYYDELQRVDEINAEMRKVYRAGGTTIEDLCLLYNKTAQQVNAILREK